MAGKYQPLSELSPVHHSTAGYFVCQSLVLRTISQFSYPSYGDVFVDALICNFFIKPAKEGDSHVLMIRFLLTIFPSPVLSLNHNTIPSIPSKTCMSPVLRIFLDGALSSLTASFFIVTSYKSSAYRRSCPGLRSIPSTYT